MLQSNLVLMKSWLFRWSKEHTLICSREWHHVLYNAPEKLGYFFTIATFLYTVCQKLLILLLEVYLGSLEGELQCQKKLISSERPLKYLQNENKIIKLFSRYSTFKIKILTLFREENDRKTENAAYSEVLHELKNNSLCEIRNDKCTIKQ